jgi:hypothetical protein
MKKYITTISLVLNVILVTIFFFFYNSFKIGKDLSDVKSAISTKHNPIANDVALSIIFGKIDSNFNLVITTMTILFTLFSFFLFKSVKDSFAHRLYMLYKRQSNSEASWAEHKSDILDLRGDLSFEVADKMSKDLTVMFDKEDKEYKDFVSIVEHTLVCCDYYSQSLAFKKSVYPKFKASVSSLIKSHLLDTAQLLSSSDKFELETLGYERFLRLQDNIHKVCDLEDKQNLASIFSKLSFPTLD